MFECSIVLHNKFKKMNTHSLQGDFFTFYLEKDIFTTFRVMSQSKQIQFLFLEINTALMSPVRTKHMSVDMIKHPINY